MWLIMFLISFLIFLVIICITNFFLSIAIKLVTNNTLEEYKFILPSILTLLITCITFLIIYLLNINMLDLNIRESVMALVFKTVDLAPKLKNILLLDVFIIILSIVIQAFCLLTVNVDYTVTIGKIRMGFKDLIKKLKNKNTKKEFINEKENNISSSDINESINIQNDTILEEETLNNENEISNVAAVIPEGEMAENKEILKLSIPNALICTLFIFSFQFFMFMALFTVGANVANKIL